MIDVDEIGRIRGDYGRAIYQLIYYGRWRQAYKTLLEGAKKEKEYRKNEDEKMA